MASERLSDVRVVLCTAPAAEAAALADRLLDEKLIACANLIGPLESRYVWQGEREVAQETLLVLKTRADLVALLQQRITALHSYEVPEVLVLPVEGGHEPYLAWVRQSCRP